MKSNQDIFIAVHIENPQSIEHVEDIMQTDVDITYVGPTDLSVSYGKTANGSRDPEIKGLIDQVKNSANNLEQSTGIIVAGLDDLRHTKNGKQIILAFSVNAIINPSLTAYVNKFNKTI